MPVIAAASDDPEARRWLEDVPSSARADDVFRDPRDTWAQGERAPFVIADVATDRAIGLVSLRVIGEGTGSIGVSVFAEGRGRGIGSSAVRLVARWALRDLAFERIEAEADVANLASRRMIEKAGFAREGILRGHCVTHGVRHDCEMFALVRSDCR